MSASSSTMRSRGRGSGTDCGLVVTDAFHESALETLFSVARAERLRRAAKAQARLVEHRDRGAELVDVGQDMRGKEQSAALRAQALQHRFHRHPRGRVKAAHRFVQYIHLAFERKPAGKAELLRHALGEA